MSRCSRWTATARRLVARHRRRGGRAYLVRDGLASSRRTGRPRPPIVEVARVPITIGGLARHNVANALAAAGGARGLGATIEPGPRRADRTSRRAPSARPAASTCSASGRRSVIVDFAHNEAGIGAVLDVAQGIAGGAAGRAAPITAIIGTAGDRPDDTLRGHRPDRRRACPAGGHQGDAQVPARPDRRVGRRRADGRRRGRRDVGRPTSRSTTPRPRRSRPS